MKNLKTKKIHLMMKMIITLMNTMKKVRRKQEKEIREKKDIPQRII